VSHVALLTAYGAGAVCPYLAFETLAAMARDGRLSGGVDEAKARASYVKAIGKGLLKVLSKMGISTLQSYSGAQTCEAVGLDAALVARHFTGTSSRIGGIGLEVLAEETLRRHAAAFASADEGIEPGSDYHFRIEGEHHNWNPRTIATLQHATRSGSATTYREFSRLADAETARFTLRGMLDLVEREPVPLDEVEPASAIVKRFRHRRDVIWLDQQGSARDTCRGDEPSRRPEQHRRRGVRIERGSGPSVRARSSRSRRRDLASPPNTWSTPRRSRSRSRRAPSLEKAASCPGTRWTT